jgi:hypothetical protein
MALKHLQNEKKAEESADTLPVYVPKKKHFLVEEESQEEKDSKLT